MGGSGIRNTIHIIGVTTMNSSKTHSVYYTALVKFKEFLAFGRKETQDWTASETSIICALTDCKVNNKTNPNIDKYIHFGILIKVN